MEFKRALWQILKVAVSAGLIVFLVVKISPGKLIPYLREMDPALLAAAAAVFFASSFLGAVQWHFLLRAGGVVLPFRTAFKLYFVGLFFNNFLPANIGGDAVKIYDIVRVGNDPYRVLAITLLDRVIGITALCILALAASLYLFSNGGIENLGIYTLVFLGCIAPVLALTLNKRLSGMVRRFFGVIRIWKIGERVDLVLGHLGGLRALRPLLARLAFLALSIQFMRIATHVLVGKSLGITLISLNFVQFFVFIPLLGLVMVLPISINGLGVREGTGVLLFTQIGFTQEQALLMEFVTYGVMVAVSLLGGGLFLLRHMRGRRG